MKCFLCDSTMIEVGVGTHRCTNAMCDQVTYNRDADSIYETED